MKIFRMSDDCVLKMYETQAELIETKQKLSETKEKLEKIQKENDELKNQMTANNLMKIGKKCELIFKFRENFS